MLVPGAIASRYLYKKGKKWGTSAGKKLSDKFLRTDAKDLTLKNVTKSQQIVNRAQAKYDSMLKKNGGKGVNNKAARKIKKQIKNITTKRLNTAANSTITKSTKDVWGKLLTKYGGKWGLSKAIMTKFGKRRGAMMLGRVMAGGLLTASGVGTVAGIAMNIATAAALYQVGKSLLSDSK